MTPTLDSCIRSLQARLILGLDRDVSYTEVLNLFLSVSLVEQAERSSVEDEAKAIFKKQLYEEMGKLAWDAVTDQMISDVIRKAAM